jgi:eukaryotic-like serine/threonine-protein kinase
MRPAPSPMRPVAPAVGATAVRERMAQPEVEQARPAPRRLPLVLVGGAAVVVAAVVGFVIMTSGPDGSPATAPSTSAVRDVGAQDAGVPGANVPPGVPVVTAERVDGSTVRFRWTYSARLDSDTFAWRTEPADGTEDGTTDGTADGVTDGTSDTPTVDLPVPAGAAVCLQVKVVRADGGNATTDWSPAGCSGP